MKHKKKFALINIIIIVSLLISIYKLYLYYSSPKSNIINNIYNYLSIRKNRINVYNKALFLNNGKSSNTCVYFVSEVLRQNGENINNSVCDTSTLIEVLKKNHYKTKYNMKYLKPGDICFTTDENLNKKGVPTHTYIFMGWEKEGSYDFAYICDNQAKDYHNKIYHLRNIKKPFKLNGNIKEPFSFFMYK